MVPEAEQDTEQHVEDSKDDGNLHFVRVHENDLIRSNLCAKCLMNIFKTQRKLEATNLPNGIQTDWIWILIIIIRAGVKLQVFVAHQCRLIVVVTPV